MILKRYLIDYLNVLFIIIQINQFISASPLQSTAASTTTKLNVIKKPPLQPDPTNQTQSTRTETVDHRSESNAIRSTEPINTHLAARLPNQDSKFNNEQSSPANKLSNSSSSSLQATYSSRSPQSDRKLNDKSELLNSNLEDRPLEANSNLDSSSQIDLQAPTNNHKLKRTKRRGRIGGKAGSSGIGHGRTGAKQDTANDSLTTKPFLIYYLILFLFTIRSNLFSNQLFNGHPVY